MGTSSGFLVFIARVYGLNFFGLLANSFRKTGRVKRDLKINESVSGFKTFGYNLLFTQFTRDGLESVNNAISYLFNNKPTIETHRS